MHFKIRRLSPWLLATSLLLSTPLWATTDADNSQRNKIHSENLKKTAEQQSNSQRDVDLTRAIRQKIVSNDSLSTNAHNIKIISNKGQVSLKGPVNSSSEKALLEQFAKEIAGQNHVTNEIEVLAH